ncbi:MAG TPA: DNA methyltransferase [Myxococcales bacterium]|nr:DNA methyltransferase [Myxococcales bacterium]HAN31138.1 DNA methyltransferase [Myxococcales bacterium]
MIKYLGSKRTLLPTLLKVLDTFPELTSVFDAFSGTSRVGHMLKEHGKQVFANDHNAYAHTLASCYVAADLEEVQQEANALLAEFQALPGKPGYFTERFCERARFFQPHNGAKVDAIRDEIERRDFAPDLKAVLMTSLMEAADRVDSTCGVQMAYVKKWAKRSYKDIELRMPKVLPRPLAGKCAASQLDVLDAASEVSADVAYLDPPYNQHSYLSNYHIWETLVRWDAPETYGIAQKRVDCRERKSDFNSKRRHHDTFERLLSRLSAKLWVVSFSDEGYQSRPEMEHVLSHFGEVHVITRDFKRYVGAQIGIHNPKGQVVGEVSHLRNREFIYVVVRPDLAALVPDAVSRLQTLRALGSPEHSAIH